MAIDPCHEPGGDGHLAFAPCPSSGTMDIASTPLRGTCPMTIAYLLDAEHSDHGHRVDDSGVSSA
jgi:hypothetical protein